MAVRRGLVPDLGGVVVLDAHVLVHVIVVHGELGVEVVNVVEARTSTSRRS
jgi:hypothetical protein